LNFTRAGLICPKAAQPRMIDGTLNLPMTMHSRWTLRTAAALLAVPLLLPSGGAPFTATPAQAQGLSASAKTLPHPLFVAQARAKQAARVKTQGPPVAAKSSEMPPREPFTAAEDQVATISGMPDARFWADSETDYRKALPPQPGPWLILSSGGADGAFGAGLLNGLTAAGKRPDYAVVTGVSTGALMAPFAFAGSRYDAALRKAYTEVTAADVFEAGASTGESFVNSWPARFHRQASYAGAARQRRRGASRRPAPVRRHQQPRCRAQRGMEHGRDRRSWRR
jgi:hypothetical protein